MASPEPQQNRGDNKEPLKKADEEIKPGLISFGFTKKINKTKTETAEERDFLTGVEGKELKSTKPVEKPKELIIPLIQKNRWYRHEGVKQEDGKEAPSSPSKQQDSVESQAIKELIEESQKQQEEWKNGPQCDPNLAIPLLMQNHVPQGFEDGEQIKVDLRPESSTEADYEQVPVEAYGLAMLKGMGWRQGEGIGRTFKQDVKPIEHQLRPKGLGLGADRSAIKDLQPSGPRRPPKPGEQRDKDDEGLVLGPGGCVLVQTGAHKDLYGKIEGVDTDNARVMVKLAIGGKSVTISQHSLRLVPRKEYDKYSKDLSRLSKAHKEKEKEKEKEREKERDREKDGARNQQRGEEKPDGKDERRRDRHSEREKERENERERDQRKRKHRETDTDREKPPPMKEPRSSPPAWLQRDLRVRFIDKTFKGGKYYNSKMRIEDVIASHVCVCRTDEGRLLDDVKQTMLETIVPKGDADSIMVVLGEHRGQVGRILKRDKEKCRAMVQLERYEEKIFTLDYDSLCHYVGER
ncbi:G-patch domain and KOW motifs-containing protein isoform X2 [Ictalurus furcatus]|uniref:G-patch domain and KOW motifs-containing protein isoform X2 n=1 Tax=Ictalurus furcatus TaxID=66913 RepID=UPI0023506BFC|nr:G-patch domain and KOW motifs-containing protein isoform X2 [Ictalurus furcatus]